MAAHIDHLILNVNDTSESAAFYARVLGFPCEGTDGPFTIVRVNETFTMQLAQWSTKGGEHLAFALSRAEFDAVLERLRSGGIAFGDAFDTVGTQKGPGNELGARGPGPTIYFFDPNKHLIEIRHYESRT